MFLRQVFGLTGSTLLAGLPEPSGSVSIWRSYLLTAAGQFRTFTGFPFHSLWRDPRTRPPYLGFNENATHTACEYLAHADVSGKQSQSAIEGWRLQTQEVRVRP